MSEITLAEMAGRMACLATGQRLAVIGIGGEGIGKALTLGGAPTRGALLLAPDRLGSVAGILDRLLDDLADLALARWPFWYGRETPLGEDVEEERPRDSVVSGPWLRAAAKRARGGRPPRFRRVARELELVQLLHAVDPSGMILIADIDPACALRAAPGIAALEWCSGHGAAVVAAFSVRPPTVAPYERVLYGACEIVEDAVPLAARFIAPRSRAHPASAMERRIEAALQDDAELSGLFSGNESVPVGAWGAHPRVDLLCREHRVVVELDGPEHRTPSKFGADRHRDYELLVAGYLVLRLTNDEVAADLQHAVEKIRAVVRLRRPSNGG